MKNKVHPLLETFIPIVEGLAETFGKNCEVVLHDIKNPQSSIVAIANSHVTGRQVGGPMSEYGLSTLKRGQFDKPKINYMKKTSDGRILKSSLMYIKDENGELIGFLCINIDVSEITVVKNILNDMFEIASQDSSVESQEDSFGSTINEVLSNIVDKTLENFGKPVAFMSKEDKVSIVEALEEKGVFLIKGAVDYVAKVLCVSRYTIYNYLDEIRVNA
ncbi:helix-turn-helix transcriptional regulator [Lutispora thermophila]|uniref:Predicted transcriptional regulator YheO, contains PAS and DNA-binding HTH domains n=1 Tax=Lutispora thermophila DSM 19022 TaxID=1122184 RepID=A0A1M6DAQ2_9FIRM|nr:PAS domain-containing protein [Lutispora thermophila]SHI70210.1 Predicted transcriptional regulator YheO, contains PAS and DNA-binding HTH domains [Lutispora thermophila DSM 19022]